MIHNRVRIYIFGNDMHQSSEPNLFGPNRCLEVLHDPSVYPLWKCSSCLRWVKIRKRYRISGLYGNRVKVLKKVAFATSIGAFNNKGALAPIIQPLPYFTQFTVAPLCPGLNGVVRNDTESECLNDHDIISICTLCSELDHP